MRWVYEYDNAAAVAFVDRIGHPIPEAVDLLRKNYAAALRGELLGAPVAYFWYAWSEPGTMAVHACVAPFKRCNWTRRDIAEIHKFPEFLGARRLVATPPEERLGRLLETLGWTRAADGWTTELPPRWNTTHCAGG